MSNRDDGRPQGGGRRKFVIGALGLATVLGGGTYLLTAQNGDDAPTSEAGAVAPATAAVSPSAATTSQPATAAADAVPPPDQPRPSSTEERIKAVRSAEAEATRNGPLVQRALPPRNAAAAAVNEDVTVTQTGDVRKDGGMIRVVSARSDLTGQRELAWAADDGEAVGSARCTQNIQLSNNPKPRVRPTLLLCWRTSATRSVYTVTVDLDKKPSKQASVAAIEKAWAKLG